MPHTKRCLYENCKSDTRFHPWLKWAGFVKPTKPKNIERANRWIYLLQKSAFKLENITVDSYICEKHFPQKHHENLDWKKNLELEPIPPNADIDYLDALYNDSSEVIETIANPAPDINNIKTEKHFKKNIKKEKHFKKKDVRANFPMDLQLQKGNSWEIQSIYDLQFYICPICRYTNSSKQEFVNHACNVHPEAIENFKQITDGSLDDINCPWKSASKEEICEHPENVIENIMIKVEPLDIDNAIEQITHQNDNVVSNSKSDFSKPRSRGDFSHKCVICGLLFPSEHSLKKHIEKRHENFEPMTIKSVEVITPQVESSNESIASELKQCGICNEKLDNESHLDDHMKSEHRLLSKNAYYYRQLDEKNISSLAKTSSNISHFQTESDQVSTKNESFVPTLNQMIKSDHPNTELSDNSDEEEEQDVSQILNQCGICDKKLSNLLELNNHMKSEHSMGRQKIDIKESQKTNFKNVKCQECGEKFFQYREMKNHFRSVHANLKTFECHICRIVSTSRQKLLLHIDHDHMHEIRPPKNYYKDLPKETKICEFCSKVYRAKTLDKHIKKVHHGIKDIKDSICDICGIAMTKANIKRHKESHIPQELRQVECDKCGYKFHSESVLKRHIDRVHNQLRTSVCQHCAKSFFDHHGLDKHIAHVHEGKKPHKCIKCGKGHSTAGNMRLHVKRCNVYKNPEIAQN